MESQFTNQENNFQQDAGYAYYSAPDLTVEDIPHPENRKYGLSRAITAAILSTVSVTIGVIAMYVVIFSMMGLDFDLEAMGYSVLFIGASLAAGSLAMSIVALVLGIKSIKCFKKKTPRPIATLILGIGSVCEAAGGIIISLYNSFFMLIVTFAFMYA